MSFGSPCLVPALAVFAALALPATAQSVISTHSGVIHYFQGAVYLGDQSLEFHVGKFPTVPQGAELRTVDGRAELLLTPDVFLRMGEKSSIRMAKNELEDTQVELQTGSVIVDSGAPNLNTSVTLIYKNWRIHFAQKGVYRIDSDPPRLWVRQGRAEVYSPASVQPIPVESGMSLPFAGVLVPERVSGHSEDGLSNWSTGRRESIQADDTITAQLDQDPIPGASGADSFTYYPLLGLPPVSLGPLSSYSAYMPNQAGFYSIYLPGYTYRPFLLGRIGVRPIGRPISAYPISAYPVSIPRAGIAHGAGFLNPVPRVPTGRSGISPAAGYITPAPQPGAGHMTSAPRVPMGRAGTVHAGPAAGIHGGAHR